MALFNSSRASYLQVLHEELRGQEPLYDKFIQAGNAVHDKCVPESKDAAHISEKMTVISKSWDRLSDRLREREKSLVSVEGLSKEFSDNVSQLGNWVADYMTTIDQLQPVTTNPEKHQEHLREIKVIVSYAVGLQIRMLFINDSEKIASVIISL